MTDVSRETPALGAHYCTGCGQMHGADQLDSAVRIAEIERDRDIELAKISKAEWTAVAQTNQETDLAVAEIRAEAGVAQTEALADGIAASGDEAELPVITDVAVPDAEPEVQESIAPRDDDEGIPDPVEPKSNWSYWG